MIDLLSPVGNFECLKAAVQNGANSVYFGADLFSARAFASNFSLEEMQQAILYAKSRGVKTNLTLNTLIKDSEFENAFNLAKKAYEFGIDAIIIQDLGLAKKIIETFPDLPVHASTQMSIHNLQGVLELEELGFKRVVLSRELSLQEIEYICKNSHIETECFIHGALCISYSGQCLFSSMIGGRSGNRGKCAQPCRLPYQLQKDNKCIDSGYLLSTRDLCGLDYIPDMINAGVTCLKIEGRMKNPEYVATVTRLYRKYIDLAESDETYVVDEQDKKDLLQAFNRGMSSSGHLSTESNRNLVYKDKPNNMGLFLGKVEKYNSNKGYVTLKLQEKLSIGDTVAFEKETGSYRISELMIKDKNIKDTNISQTVTIGRMKGNINLGDSIFKMSSQRLNSIANESIQKENRKVGLSAKIIIKKGVPIELFVSSANNLPIYKNLSIYCKSDIIPEQAQKRPLEVQKVLAQLNKTTDSLYEFKHIEVDLEDDVFLPKFSIINELRRTALDKVYSYACNQICRYENKNVNRLENMQNISLNNKTCNFDSNLNNTQNNLETKTVNSKTDISILLNILDFNLDYKKLNNVDKLYIPLKYFANQKYESILNTLQEKGNLYIYMPTIIKANYRNLFFSIIENTLNKYKIKGFIISNISNLKLLENVYDSSDLNNNRFNDKDNKVYSSQLDYNSLELIGNYTLNIFNSYSVQELKNLKLNSFTISPELDKSTMLSLTKTALPNELIVYGNIPLMNMNYCVLGKANKCYPTCDSYCMSNSKYVLHDRLNMDFRVLFDNIQTVSTIYNSKTTSLSLNDFNFDDYHINCARIDFLDESIEDMNLVINQVKSGKRLEGKNYTNGNLNREI